MALTHIEDDLQWQFRLQFSSDLVIVHKRPCKSAAARCTALTCTNIDVVGLPRTRVEPSGRAFGAQYTSGAANHDING